MKRKCDECNNPATHHSVEIIKGQKIEKHLCEQHAVEAGMSVKTVQTPINELLTKFVNLHDEASRQSDVVCDNCGLRFSEFREHSLMGCPQCYTAFEEQLAPLLERAHEGAIHHIGKVPRRAGAGQERQQQLMRMRKRLATAVEAEDFELAARLRDDIMRFEEQGR